jgi:hypothetical protein
MGYSAVHGTTNVTRCMWVEATQVRVCHAWLFHKLLQLNVMPVHNTPCVAMQGAPSGASPSTAVSSSKKSAKKAAKRAKKPPPKQAPPSKPLLSGSEPVPDGPLSLLQQQAKDWAGMVLGWGCSISNLTSAIVHHWKVLDWLEVRRTGLSTTVSTHCHLGVIFSPIIAISPLGNCSGGPRRG